MDILMNTKWDDTNQQAGILFDDIYANVILTSTKEDCLLT